MPCIIPMGPARHRPERRDSASLTSEKSDNGDSIARLRTGASQGRGRVL